MAQAITQPMPRQQGGESHTAVERIAVFTVATRPGHLKPHQRNLRNKDIAEAVVYLTEAGHVTGEVLHVDGGAHGAGGER